MKVSVGDIADGSQGFRVWFHEEVDSEPADSGEPYQVVGVFERISDDSCMIGYTMGDLSDEVNIAIAIAAYKNGYKFLKIYVKKGIKVSRWFNFERSDKQFDYYCCDLDKAFEKLANL